MRTDSILGAMVVHDISSNISADLKAKVAAIAVFGTTSSLLQHWSISLTDYYQVTHTALVVDLPSPSTTNLTSSGSALSAIQSAIMEIIGRRIFSMLRMVMCRGLLR